MPKIFEKFDCFLCGVLKIHVNTIHLRHSPVGVHCNGWQIFIELDFTDCANNDNAINTFA